MPSRSLSSAKLVIPIITTKSIMVHKQNLLAYRKYDEIGRAIGIYETAHFALQNDPFRTLKRAVSQCVLGHFATHW